ncbi:hypothetical protein FM109_12230 [Vibrio casei]|nr:hypothetical protein FM109_12230 [Vibrio casei]
MSYPISMHISLTEFMKATYQFRSNISFTLSLCGNQKVPI